MNRKEQHNRSPMSRPVPKRLVCPLAALGVLFALVSQHCVQVVSLEPFREKVSPVAERAAPDDSAPPPEPTREPEHQRRTELPSEEKATPEEGFFDGGSSSEEPRRTPDATPAERQPDIAICESDKDGVCRTCLPTKALYVTSDNHKSRPGILAFDPSSQTFASAADDSAFIRILDTVSGKRLTSLASTSQGIYHVAWSPDGQRLISASKDHTIAIWDPKAGRLSRILGRHSDTIVGLTYTSDGKRILSASANGKIKVWSVATSKELRTIDVPSGDIFGFAYAPNGKTFVTISSDGTSFWDVAKETIVHSRKWGSTGRRLSYSPDSKMLVTGHNETVYFWSAETGALLHEHYIGRLDVYHVIFAPDSKTFAVFSAASLEIRDVRTGKILHIVKPYVLGASLAWSPNGRFLIADSRNTTVTAWTCP